jgi:phosphoribosylglycinamide formyltransferase-1
MPRLVNRSTIAKRRARLVRLVESLPEGSISGDQHLSLFVRGKRYGYYLDDHHGDGRVALACKAEPGVNRARTEAEPERFHIPAYVGPKGWLGLWLDLPDIDWDEVEEVVLDAYCLTAPKKLVAEVRADG